MKLILRGLLGCLIVVLLCSVLLAQHLKVRSADKGGVLNLQFRQIDHEKISRKELHQAQEVGKSSWAVNCAQLSFVCYVSAGKLVAVGVRPSWVGTWSKVKLLQPINLRKGCRISFVDNPCDEGDQREAIYLVMDRDGFLSFYGKSEKL